MVGGPGADVVAVVVAVVGGAVVGVVVVAVVVDLLVVESCAALSVTARKSWLLPLADASRATTATVATIATIHNTTLGLIRHSL